jgi:hypothetical protein
MTDKLIEAIAEFVEGISETTGFGRQIAAELLQVMRTEPVLGEMVERAVAAYNAEGCDIGIAQLILSALTPDEQDTGGLNDGHGRR